MSCRELRESRSEREMLVIGWAFNLSMPPMEKMEHEIETGLVSELIPIV